MPRKKRTPLVLTDGEVRHAISRLSSVLHRQPPPWAGGPTVDLEALADVYAAHRRRLVAAVEWADTAATVMVAMFETENTELRDRARAIVDSQRAYWQRRRLEVPAIDPALVGGDR